MSQTSLFTVLLVIAVPVVLSFAFFLLYRNGLLTIQSKTAVSFMGKFGGMRASFSGCTGTLRRMIHFPEGREYTYTLASVLTKGELAVDLYDRTGNLLFTLTPEAPTATVAADAGSRCTMVIRFEKATGRYELQRD